MGRGASEELVSEVSGVKVAHYQQALAVAQSVVAGGWPKALLVCGGSPALRRRLLEEASDLAGDSSLLVVSARVSDAWNGQFDDRLLMFAEQALQRLCPRRSLAVAVQTARQLVKPQGAPSDEVAKLLSDCFGYVDQPIGREETIEWLTRLLDMLAKQHKLRLLVSLQQVDILADDLLGDLVRAFKHATGRFPSNVALSLSGNKSLPSRLDQIDGDSFMLFRVARLDAAS